jgi:hypothetical protein
VSAKLVRSFQVDTRAHSVSSLSVSRRTGLLLIGEMHSTNVFLYTMEGKNVSSISLPQGDKLSDVAWTPLRDNIVYTGKNSELGLNDAICVMSVNGVVIARTKWFYSVSHYISVSSDNTIYITHIVHGLSVSKDDGITWTRVQPILLNSQPKWEVEYAIKVSNANHTADELWSLERTFSGYNYRLRACKLDSQSGNVLNSWRNITQFTSAANNYDIFKLLYDGDSNVYMLSSSGEKSLSVFSVNGDYVCQLFSFKDYVIPIRSLAVSRQRDFLYLGTNSRYISVYALSYDIRKSETGF